MKKTGFTLAEVLITLAIIGVVATMTLPALMNNTQEQQSRTGFKKMMNTLTHIGEMAQADAGVGYTDMTTGGETDKLSIPGDGSAITHLSQIFGGYGAIDLANTGAGTSYGATADNFIVTFRDGMSIQFPAAATAVGAIQNDNLPYGIKALVDINGKKGPNILSNCADTPSTTATTDGGTDTLCQSANKRIIKDRFGVRLRGAIVAPNGPAARYAYNK